MLKKEKKKGFFARYNDMPRAMQRGKYIFVYSLLLIPVIGFCVFYIGVNINGILLAFQQPVILDDGRTSYIWSLRQFALVWEAFRDPGSTSTLKISLINTMLYFGESILIQLPLSFILSYYFHKKIPGSTFFRVAIYLPSIISAVAMVTMFKTLIAPDGPIAMLLSKWFDYKMPYLLGQNSTATITIMFYTFWVGLCGNVLLLEGTFNRVPKDIIDAGRLDGVSGFREMISIYFPMIRGTVGTLIVLSFTGLFNASGPILVMTEGRNNTSTISYWIYDMVKVQGNYNLPAAAGLVMTLIGIPIVVLVRKLVLPKEDEQY